MAKLNRYVTLETMQTYIGLHVRRKYTNMTIYRIVDFEYIDYSQKKKQITHFKCVDKHGKPVTIAALQIGSPIESIYEYHENELKKLDALLEEFSAIPDRTVSESLHSDSPALSGGGADSQEHPDPI